MIDELLKQIGIGVASIGGWAAITYILSSWIGARLAQKLNINWIKQKEKEVEKLKSDLTRDREILNNTISTISKQYQVSQERRLKSLEELWKNIIEIRKFFWPLQFFFNILLPEEYNSVYKDDKFEFKSSLSQITFETISDFFMKISPSIELSRPYIGIKLWSLFYLYRAFIGRIVFVFDEGRKKNNINSWHSDKHTIKLLKLALNEEVFERISKDKLFFLNNAIDLIERKILTEMENIITGTSISELTISKAEKIIQEIEAINIKIAKSK